MWVNVFCTLLYHRISQCKVPKSSNVIFLFIYLYSVAFFLTSSNTILESFRSNLKNVLHSEYRRAKIIQKHRQNKQNSSLWWNILCYAYVTSILHRIKRTVNMFNKHCERYTKRAKRKYKQVNKYNKQDSIEIKYHSPRKKHCNGILFKQYRGLFAPLFSFNFSHCAALVLFPNFRRLDFIYLYFVSRESYFRRLNEIWWAHGWAYSVYK